MTHIRIVRANIHSGHRIRTGYGVQHQRITGNGSLRLFSGRQDRDGGTIGADAAVLTDRLRRNQRSRPSSPVYDLGTGIQILAGAGKGNSGKFHVGMISL